MDCTRCEKPITGNRWENAVAIERSDLSGEFVHFECVEDPTRLTPLQFQRWAAWWMERERERREAFQEHVDAELVLLHRAIRALPHHLNHAYIEEIYGEPDADAPGVGPGLTAGNCTTCGRPVFYNGQRDQDCRPVLAGHAPGCRALRAAQEV